MSAKKQSPNFRETDKFEASSDKYSKLDIYRQYPVEDRTVMWEQNRKRRLDYIKSQTKDSELTE
jgi:hypothetical protein